METLVGSSGILFKFVPPSFSLQTCRVAVNCLHAIIKQYVSVCTVCVCVMYMFVCVYVCVCTHVHVCVCLYVYVFMCTRICVFCVCMRLCVCVYTHLCVCTRVHMCVYMCICVCPCECSCAFVSMCNMFVCFVWVCYSCTSSAQLNRDLWPIKLQCVLVL